MDSIQQKVTAVLDSMNIDYEIIEHPAVYTVEDIDRLNLPQKESIVKNLFIRDDKKREYFLVILQKDKSANLKKTQKALHCRRLSFASEEDLTKYLGVSKGSVTPFGILNDTERKVTVVIDQDILCFEQVGVHPNENTATVLLKPQDLEKVIRTHGNELLHIKM